MYGQHLTNQGCPKDGSEMQGGLGDGMTIGVQKGGDGSKRNRRGTESQVDSQTGELGIRDTRG